MKPMRPGHKGSPALSLAAAALGLAGLGAGIVVFGLTQRKQARRPLSRSEFQEYIDPHTGSVLNIQSLLEVISTRGLETELKSELWPLLLGIRSPTSTAEELVEQYAQLKQQYLECVSCCKGLAASLERTIFQAAQQHGSASVQLPHELAQFSEAQRIIIMDAIRTDLAAHAAALASSSPPPSPEQGPQPYAPAHMTSSYAAEHYAELLASPLTHDTLWLSSAARDVLESSQHISAVNKYQCARLITILLAYASHDPDTGYCQGMSDLLVPVLVLVEDDALAFACFCQIMRLARSNFAVDESGIHAQLRALSALLQACDPPLHHKLRQLGASHMHFAYRMLVVLLRRDLPAPQVLLLWEMMWAEDRLRDGALSTAAPPLVPNASMVAAAAGSTAAAPQALPAALPGDNVPGTAAAGDAAQPAAVAAATAGGAGAAGSETSEAGAAAGDVDAEPAADAAAGSTDAGGTAASPTGLGAQVTSLVEWATQSASAAAEAVVEAAVEVVQAAAGETTPLTSTDSSSSGGGGDAQLGSSLLLRFVAAAIMSQRRKVLDDCRECDDVLRLYNTARLDFSSCLRKAFHLRAAQAAGQRANSQVARQDSI